MGKFKQEIKVDANVTQVCKTRFIILGTMARNKQEQIAYLKKRRQGGMSDADFKKELERLYDIGFKDGRDYDIPTMSIRD